MSSLESSEFKKDIHPLTYLFLSGHVTEGGSVSEGLSLHDPLHVGGPSVLRGDNTARRRHETVRDDDLNAGKKNVSNFSIKHEKKLQRESQYTLICTVNCATVTQSLEPTFSTFLSRMSLITLQRPSN